MSEQITVQYVNAPKPGKTNGSVKTQDGRYLGVKPEMLSQFTQGGTYMVEVSSRQWQGKTFYNIQSIVSSNGGTAPPNISQQDYNSALGHHNTSTGKPAWAGADNSKEGYWARKELADIQKQPRIERQHAQEMMLRYFALRPYLITDELSAKDCAHMMREMTSWFQRDIGHVPEAPAKQVAPEPEPTPDDNDEPF